MIVYLNQPTIIPFYFHQSGRVLLDSSLSGFVKIYQLSPSFSEIQGNFPDLIFSDDYNAYIFHYNFPSTIFHEGSFLIKAFLPTPGSEVLTSQKLINIKNISTDLSLFDLFEISKFILTEDLEDIDIDRLILVFELSLDYVQGFLGRNIVPKLYEETILITPTLAKTRTLTLKQYPIISIEECKIHNSNIKLPYQIIDYSTGRLYISYNLPIQAFIYIKYKAGEYPIPQGLLNAIYYLTGLLYERTKYMNFDKITALGITQSLNKDSLKELEKMLIKYKRIL